MMLGDMPIEENLDERKPLPSLPSADVIEWLKERAANCHRLAVLCKPKDVDGWLDDMRYFDNAIRLLSLPPSEAGTVGETTRIDRQISIGKWAVAAFGEAEATSLPQRGVRLLEEAAEAAQSTGVSLEQAKHLMEYVWGRPAGELYQELGGVGVTALALAHAAGLDADKCEAIEVHRVLGKPIEHFTKRNKEKNDAGLLAALKPSQPSGGTPMLFEEVEKHRKELIFENEALKRGLKSAIERIKGREFTADLEKLLCANTAEKNGTYAIPAEAAPTVGTVYATNTTETTPAKTNTTALPESVPSRESTLPELDELEKVERFSTREIRWHNDYFVFASSYDRCLSALTAARAQVEAPEQEHEERDTFSERVEQEREAALDKAEIAEAKRDYLAAQVEKMKQQLANRARSLASENQGLRDELALLQQQEPRWRSVETELPPPHDQMDMLAWIPHSHGGYRDIVAYGEYICEDEDCKPGDPEYVEDNDDGNRKRFGWHRQEDTHGGPYDTMFIDLNDRVKLWQYLPAKPTASPAPYAPPEKETGG